MIRLMLIAHWPVYHYYYYWSWLVHYSHTLHHNLSNDTCTWIRATLIVGIMSPSKTNPLSNSDPSDRGSGTTPTMCAHVPLSGKCPWRTKDHASILLGNALIRKPAFDLEVRPPSVLATWSLAEESDQATKRSSRANVPRREGPTSRSCQSGLNVMPSQAHGSMLI